MGNDLNECMSTETQRMNAESLAEILAVYGVEASKEQCMNIANDFADHISMMGEMDSYMHDAPAKPEKDPKIEELEKENAILRIELGNRVGSHFLDVSKGRLEIGYDRHFEKRDTRYV